MKNENGIFHEESFSSPFLTLGGLSGADYGALHTVQRRSPRELRNGSLSGGKGPWKAAAWIILRIFLGFRISELPEWARTERFLRFLCEMRDDTGGTTAAGREVRGSHENRLR